MSNIIVVGELLQPIQSAYKQLKEMIRTTVSDSAMSKPTMLDRCYELYSNNSMQIKAVYQFAQRYQSADAVYWYTRDTFIYRIINRTLRLGDVELFHKLRFFIGDLSRQLSELRKEQQKRHLHHSEITILYRGLRQSQKHLQDLTQLCETTCHHKRFYVDKPKQTDCAGICMSCRRAEL